MKKFSLLATKRHNKAKIISGMFSICHLGSYSPGHGTGFKLGLT